MEEFKKQNLHIVYKEEIAEWFNYLDQQEFGKELEGKMLAEIERYIKGKKTIEELINETFPQPKIEWEKIFIEGISQNYFFKAVLGYA
jgi:hypothetical protein